ncbi:UNKNOWN [Stylonychia lemnae]|uniref:Uncharacterized protein n=1 Tax=Stylonychia lemnae TaxID=5949 RepID=A0A078AF55_STYLE|nr:UNKNOWN [Stylonychia lemnae]|eukprot:CDW80157.1 UNKNOWN [Stylonychia lemnae]
MASQEQEEKSSQQSENFIFTQPSKKYERKRPNLSLQISEELKLEKLYDIEQEWLDRHSNKQLSASSDKIKVPGSPLIPYSEPVIDLPQYLILKTSQNTQLSPGNENLKLQNVQMTCVSLKTSKKRKYSEFLRTQTSQKQSQSNVTPFRSGSCSRRYLKIKSRYRQETASYKKHCCFKKDLSNYTQTTTALSNSGFNMEGNATQTSQFSIYDSKTKRKCYNNRKSLTNRTILRNITNIFETEQYRNSAQRTSIAPVSLFDRSAERSSLHPSIGIKRQRSSLFSEQDENKMPLKRRKTSFLDSTKASKQKAANNKISEFNPDTQITASKLR